MHFYSQSKTFCQDTKVLNPAYCIKNKKVKPPLCSLEQYLGMLLEYQ